MCQLRIFEEQRNKRVKRQKKIKYIGIEKGISISNKHFEELIYEINLNILIV